MTLRPLLMLILIPAELVLALITIAISFVSLRASERMCDWCVRVLPNRDWYFK